MSGITLEQLYEMQKELDARIIKEKGLEGQDLLPNTVLALQVEVGELANEWRGFKHWSNDREPRIKRIHSDRDAYLETNPLLEEYVDSLHFILSIGRQLDLDITFYQRENLADEFIDVCEVFRHTFNWITNLDYIRERVRTLPTVKQCYSRLLDAFLTLGDLLGFTWEQIAIAYLEKNKTNHDRQANGY